MAILDSQGRLFGKVSILDIGAALVILSVIIGIFFFPGTSGTVAQLGSTTKPVEVDVWVRTAMSNPLNSLKVGEKTNLIIRNQPYGNVTIKAIREVPQTVAVPQPDGSVKSLPDPRPQGDIGRNFVVTLSGTAQITKNGPVLGNNKIKVGVPIEIEGFNYNFANLNVLDLRIQE
jgi:hypothetical protein